MQWWTHLLVVGGSALTVPTVILMVCLRWGRAAFVEDYPPDIRAALPQFDRTEIIAGRVLGPLFLLSLLGALWWTTWSWVDDPDRGFLSAYPMALGVFVLFALIDLVIVDWLVICWWRPRWVVIPGTEDAVGWADYGFHLRVQLTPKALITTFALPAVVAGVALAVPH